MADYIARKTRVGLGLKDSWGSVGDWGVGLSNPDFTLLVDPAQLNNAPAVVREELQLTSATGLITERSRSVTDYTSGIHRLGFGGVAIQDQLPLFLWLALFKATETDLTVPNPDNFQQVFFPFADTDIPDFTDPFTPPAGGSTNTKPPVASLVVDWLTGHNSGATTYDDCILNSLTLALNVNNQGIARFLNVSGEFACAKIAEDANGSGFSFPTAPAITTYNNASPFTFTLAGSASYTGCFKSFQLNINNNVTSDCRTTGGRVNNYRISPEYMVDFTIPVNETTDILAGGLLAGTEQTITLSTGTTQTLGYLNIVAKGALTGDVKRMIENNVWVYKGQLKCELPSSGNSLTVTMCSLTQLIS